MVFPSSCPTILPFLTAENETVPGKKGTRCVDEPLLSLMILALGEELMERWSSVFSFRLET